MKRTAVILLMLILCLYTGGSYLAFQLKRNSIKTQVRAYLKEHSTEKGTQFSFNTSRGEITDPAFQWVESHEFRYKGKMFDVISVKKKNDKILIHCISDDEENQLIAVFASLQKSRNKNESSGGLKFATSVFELPQTENSNQVFISFKRYYPSAETPTLCLGFVGLNEQPPRS